MFKELNERRGGNDGSPPEMDFKSYGILFLEMGQKPTGGFSINFDPSLTRVVGGQLAIHVGWVVPKEGKLVTQVVTSPFILLKIMHVNIDSILVCVITSYSIHYTKLYDCVNQCPGSSTSYRVIPEYSKISSTLISG